MEKKWHLHLATPRKFLDKKCKMPSLFLSAPPPPKRAPSTTLTLRSKSMTAELEELGERRGGGRRGWARIGWAHAASGPCAPGAVLGGGAWPRAEPFQLVGMGQGVPADPPPSGCPPPCAVPAQSCGTAGLVETLQVIEPRNGWGWMGAPGSTSAVGLRSPPPPTRALPWPRTLPGMGHPAPALLCARTPPLPPPLTHTHTHTFAATKRPAHGSSCFGTAAHSSISVLSPPPPSIPTSVHPVTKLFALPRVGNLPHPTHPPPPPSPHISPFAPRGSHHPCAMGRRRVCCWFRGCSAALLSALSGAGGSEQPGAAIHAG